MTEDPKESGSFLTGFMLGIAAGALGYFAFGTRKGADIRKRLQDEWESAQEMLQRESMEQIGESFVGKSIFDQAKGFIEKSISSLEIVRNTEIPGSKQSSKKQKTVGGKKSRFRGT